LAASRVTGNGFATMDDRPMTDAAGPVEREPEAERHAPIPAVGPFVLIAAGAALMAGAVFGTELVHRPGAMFTWSRLEIAGAGLLILLVGLAWFADPPGTDERIDD
jgi:hypothetical protein